MTMRATVIVYHTIGDCPLSDDRHELYVATDTFEEQMAFLKRHRTVVPLSSIAEGRLPSSGSPRVAITFDDGYRNVLTVAAPILARYGLPATVFVPTRWIGDHNTWVQPYACPLDIMSAAELLEVEGSGIAVESHGHSHIDFEQASDQEVVADLARSVEILADTMGRRPRHFAYPWGRYGPRSPALVEAAGFDAAWSIERRTGGAYARERVWIRPFHGLRVFSLKTSGWWGAFRWGWVGRATGAVVRPLFFRRPA